MKRNKGFTLIELLVVIAIIGILSAIVLASLSTARTKANAAKVQSQLASLRAAAEIYSSSWSSSYGTALTATGCVTTGPNVYADTTSGAAALIGGIVTTAGGVGNTSCAVGTGGASWAATAALPGGSGTTAYWCVDSNGASKPESNATFSGGAGAEKCA